MKRTSPLLTTAVAEAVVVQEYRAVRRATAGVLVSVEEIITPRFELVESRRLLYNPLWKIPA